MVQLQRMDARLDTFSMKFYQVNVCVNRIARWQASIGGFAPEATPSPPSPVASESEDDDDDASDDANGNTTLCHSWQKGGVVLDMRVVTLKGRVSFWIIVLGGVLFLF